MSEETRMCNNVYGSSVVRKLPRYKNCFVCGHHNSSGLKMVWQATHEGGVVGKYTTASNFCGYEGIIHGGIISALLDECLGWAVGITEKTMFYTGELNVVFKAPLPVDTLVTIKGYYSKDQDPTKKYKVGQGEIVDKEGLVYATASGKFFPIPQEIEQEILNFLELPEADRTGITSEDLWGS